MPRMTFVETLGAILWQLAPALAAVAAILLAFMVWNRRLGLIGQVAVNPLGLAGMALVLFWALTGMMAP